MMGTDPGRHFLKFLLLLCWVCSSAAPAARADAGTPDRVPSARSQRVFVEGMGAETLILTRLPHGLDWEPPEFQGFLEREGTTWFQPLAEHRQAGRFWVIFLTDGKPPVKQVVELGARLDNPFLGVGDVLGGAILQDFPPGELSVLNQRGLPMVETFPVRGVGETLSVDLRRATRWILLPSNQADAIRVADIPPQKDRYQVFTRRIFSLYAPDPIPVQVYNIPNGYFLNGQQAGLAGSRVVGRWPPGTEVTLVAGDPSGREYEARLSIPPEARGALRVGFAELFPLKQEYLRLRLALGGKEEPPPWLPSLLETGDLDVSGVSSYLFLKPDGLQFDIAHGLQSVDIRLDHEFFFGEVRVIRRGDGSWPAEANLLLQRKRVVEGTLVPTSFLDAPLELRSQPSVPRNLFGPEEAALSVFTRVDANGRALPQKVLSLQISERDKERLLDLTRRYRFSRPRFNGVPVSTEIELIIRQTE